MSSPLSLPGRLGDHNMTVDKDPRTLPRLAKLLKDMGMTGGTSQPYPELDLAKLAPSTKQFHEMFSAVYDNLPNELPEDANEAEVEESVVSIDGVDGNKIKLYVFRPKDAGDAELPGVAYIHGGGGVVLNTNNKVHLRWCKSLALLGTVAFAVDFRNAWTEEKHNPFPAGLNDCASAVQYITTHKAELGINKFVLQGESGGANLALATTLKANREGWIKSIDGVYACVPAIAGAAYSWSQERKLKELPSLVENDGYLLNVPSMTGTGFYYSPGDGEMSNPLAWPYYAKVEDMKGMPPHILSMDELDPLRDEGLAYFRKLAAAGVEVTAEVNLGLVHASSLIFRQVLPEVHKKALRHIAAFSKSL